jgi:hypothetical protein
MIDGTKGQIDDQSSLSVVLERIEVCYNSKINELDAHLWRCGG